MNAYKRTRESERILFTRTWRLLWNTWLVFSIFCFQAFQSVRCTSFNTRSIVPSVTNNSIIHIVTFSVLVMHNYNLTVFYSVLLFWDNEIKIIELDVTSLLAWVLLVNTIWLTRLFISSWPATLHRTGTCPTCKFLYCHLDFPTTPLIGWIQHCQLRNESTVYTVLLFYPSIYYD